MEKIIGINEVRPKLSSIIDVLDTPVIITVNSEPKGVLLRYDDYLRLSKAEKKSKRLALKLAVEKTRMRGSKAGLTGENVSEEIADYLKSKRGQDK